MRINMKKILSLLLTLLVLSSCSDSLNEDGRLGTFRWEPTGRWWHHAHHHTSRLFKRGADKGWRYGIEESERSGLR